MTTAQERAKHELERMQQTLGKWLAMRRWNDEVAEGTRPGKFPTVVAEQLVSANRDHDLENRMAQELRVLLSVAYDPGIIPLDSLNAVQLADIVVTGKLPTQAASAQAQGFAPIFIILPIILLGVGWIIGKTITSLGEKAYWEEKGLACRAGNDTACGSPWWLKWVVVGSIGWLVFRREISGAVSGARARLTR